MHCEHKLNTVFSPLWLCKQPEKPKVGGVKLHTLHKCTVRGWKTPCVRKRKRIRCMYGGCKSARILKPGLVCIPPASSNHQHPGHVKTILLFYLSAVILFGLLRSMCCLHLVRWVGNDNGFCLVLSFLC